MVCAGAVRLGSDYCARGEQVSIRVLLGVEVTTASWVLFLY